MKHTTPKFPALLHGGDYNPGQWLDRPDILEQDLVLMKEAGCNAMSLGIFDWIRLEPQEGRYDFDWLEAIIDRLYANGIYTVLATPSGARPSWMAQKYPEVLRVGSDGERILFSGRHNHCLSSPVYRKKVHDINAALAKRFGSHPAVILWHISNEYGGECHCELCQENFRKWLKKKYKTLDTLNRAYWSAFWSHTYTDWSQLHSPSEHGEHSIHNLVLDWKRFTTDMTVDFMKAEAAPIREICPEIPVTTNMMELYSGLNYYKFKDVCDVLSWDNYPLWHSEGENSVPIHTAMAHDMIRSIHPDRPWLMMESSPSATNWQPVCKLRRPGMHMLSSLQAVAHGSDSVQYFQWRKGRGGSEKFHGAVVDHYGKSDTRVFREVSAVGSRLKNLSPSLCGAEYPAKAAILYDVENRWAIEQMQGLHNGNQGYMEELEAFYAPFFHRGVNVDLVDMESDFSGYELLIAPMLYMFRAGIGEKLRRFVKEGGTLVMSCFSGIVDENDLCYLGGMPGEGMMEVLGLRSEETDALYPQDRNTALVTHGLPGMKPSYEIHSLCDLIHLSTAKPLAEYGKNFYAGLPALTANTFGKGKAYYVACRMESAFYEDFLGALFQELSLLPPVSLPEKVTVNTRINSDTGAAYYIFQNFNSFPILLDLPEGWTDTETNTPVFQLSIEGYGVRVVSPSQC